MLRLILVIIAVAAGGGAAWIAAQQTAPEPVVVTAPPVETDMTAVLVAVRDVSRGNQVKVGDLRWQPWPVDAVPQTSVSRSDRPGALTEFAGQFAKRQIWTGEPITAQGLTKETYGFLSMTLAPDMRAAAIRVDAESTAGGFILPNDRVDVLHTVKVSRDDIDARSMTILKNVRILAIDQTTEEGDTGTVLGKTATLELTEAQVEAVTAAASTGTLSLSLRPIQDIPGETSMTIQEPPMKIRVRRGNILENSVVN